MPELTIQSIVCCSLNTSYAGGQVEARFGDTKLSIDLTDADKAELHAFSIRVAQREQARIAREIAEAQPLQLTHVPDAEWDEVPIDLP